jgi:2-polyprenyl-3-methyl-5-hydroxy-6-metoxy-1,4-benzoquinol methylase
MPVLSARARAEKLDFFFRDVSPQAKILEVGCADEWLRAALRERGYRNYYGLDLAPPADYVGDVREWRRLGLAPASFDVIVAFEVLEHVDCVQALFDVLRPDGRLFVTMPHPRWDWACRLLEAARLTQKRTSPHDHLVDIVNLSPFETEQVRRYNVLSQWGIFRKYREASAHA